MLRKKCSGKECPTTLGKKRQTMELLRHYSLRIFLRNKYSGNDDLLPAV